MVFVIAISNKSLEKSRNFSTQSRVQEKLWLAKEAHAQPPPPKYKRAKSISAYIIISVLNIFYILLSSDIKKHVMWRLN